MKGSSGCMPIYPKDVQQLTRKSVQNARIVIRKIKAKLGKQKDQCITVTEFCEYMGLKVEEVILLLRL